ncbi:MAG: hypothetical protein AB1599_00145 [Planctomycetota bacterium]
MGDEYVKDKDKNQILSELKGTALPGSVVHEQQKMAIMIRCTEDIEKTIEGLRKQIELSTKETSSLNRGVFWLTFILAVATVVGAFATVWNVFCKK